MDLLWKKESSDAEAIFMNIFEKISSYLPCSIGELKSITDHIIFKEITDKNDQMAMKLLIQGDTNLKEKKWHEAMHFYNQCLRFTQNKTESASLSYANRSECFFHLKMYDKCLIDIDLAKMTGCPQHLMPKLDTMRAFCLEQLQNINQFEEFVPKLSYEAGKHFPGMADILQIECNETFGRHITAKCCIDVGKTVLIEGAFLSEETKEDDERVRCDTCLKCSMNFIACDKCTFVMFCNESCAQKNIFHRMECQDKNLNLLQTDLKCEFRSIFAALNTFPNIDELMEFVEDALKKDSSATPQTINDAKSKYRAFLKLYITESVKKDKQLFARSYFLYTELMARDFIKAKFDTKKKQHFLMHLVVHGVFIISSNGLKCDGHMSIYNLFCNLNHSCTPNLLYIDNGTQMICITVRSIKRGEQLFVSYITGLPPSLQSNNFGRAHIFNTFGFKCECEKCTADFWPFHSHKISSDPDFIWLSNEFREERQKGFFNRQNTLVLWNKCFELLGKYDNEQWSVQKEAVLNAAYHLLKMLFNKF